jgi:hypothetical protein
MSLSAARNRANRKEIQIAKPEYSLYAHRLKFAQRRGLSQKVSDEFVVPLCAIHHGELHRAAHEEKWWKQQAVAPLAVAAELWQQHHQSKVSPRVMHRTEENPGRAKHDED